VHADVFAQREAPAASEHYYSFAACLAAKVHLCPEVKVLHSVCLSVCPVGPTYDLLKIGMP